MCEPSGSYSPTDSLVGGGNASNNDLIEVKCEPSGGYSPTDSLVCGGNASSNDFIVVKR